MAVRLSTVNTYVTNLSTQVYTAFSGNQPVSTWNVIGRLSTGGNTTLNGTLSVVGNTQTGHLSVVSNLSVAGTTTITGALAANGGITCDSSAFTVADVTGNTGILGTLSVGGATVHVGALSVIGNTTTGHLSIVSNLSVAGTTTLVGATTVTGAFAANGGFTCDSSAFTVADVTGNTAIAGTLSVGGSTTVGPILRVSATGFQANFGSGMTTGSPDGVWMNQINVSHTAIQAEKQGVAFRDLYLNPNGGSVFLANATGAVTVQSNLFVSNNLSVTGTTTLAGALVANGGIACDTNRFMVADTTGNTAIAGTLNVTGVTTLTGALNANGGFACDSTVFTVADVTGNTTIAGTLSVGGAATLVGNTSMNGTLSVIGNTTTGHLSVISNIWISGTGLFMSNVTIQGNLYLSQAFTPPNLATPGTLSVDGHTTLQGNLSVTGDVTLQGYQAFGVREWVRFSGNTNILGSSPNISNITRLDQGNFRCVFTTNLPTSNYAVCGNAALATGNTNGNAGGVVVPYAYRISSFDFEIQDQTNNTGNDPTNTNLMVIY